jgi:hypothetical protein
MAHPIGNASPGITRANGGKLSIPRCRHVVLPPVSERNLGGQTKRHRIVIVASGSFAPLLSSGNWNFKDKMTCEKSDLSLKQVS